MLDGKNLCTNSHLPRGHLGFIATVPGAVTLLQMNPSMLVPNPRAARFTRKLSAVGTQPAKRRSSRMALNAQISVSGTDRLGHFTAPVRATNLNRYGAAIQTNRELSVGSIITVRNRGTELSARIVAHLSFVDGVRSYGIEFLEQDDRSVGFWGIAFPAD